MSNVYLWKLQNCKHNKSLGFWLVFWLLVSIPILIFFRKRNFSDSEVVGSWDLFVCPSGLDRNGRKVPNVESRHIMSRLVSMKISNKILRLRKYFSSFPCHRSLIGIHDAMPIFLLNKTFRILLAFCTASQFHFDKSFRGNSEESVFEEK
jgi:hypothetical protein